MKKPARRWLAFAAASAAVSGALVGCTPASDSVKVALLLPDAKTARYEAFDRPLFENRIAELGDFSVLYSNADQNSVQQQSQAEAALASGAAVLVLDPVDSAAAVSIVSAANAQGIPVIAYDRIVDGGDLSYYISFNNEEIGALQANALVDELDARGLEGGGILMVNGSPTDGNAGQFKEGAEAVLNDSGYRVLSSFDTPEWSPENAQNWVAGQVTQFSGDIVAVYAANDGTAGGAIAALKAANVLPMPLVTGQDAELAAIQRIVSGDQYMTIYKDIRAEAVLAAEVAAKLANGKAVIGDQKINGIESSLLDAEIVTVDTILTTVVADGLFTVDQICTPEYAAACAAAGIA